MQDTLDYFRERVARAPTAVLVLGSGLGSLADEVEHAVRLPYADIPGFPRSTVVGHEGALVVGELWGAGVAVLAGRLHLYEGWDAGEVVKPIRALRHLGAELLLMTNAAGGIRSGMVPGDLMLLADHINLTGRNPLLGRVQQGEERFPDMSQTYDRRLRRLLQRRALAAGIPLQEGVYAAMLGPSYETPAEIRLLRRLGADAVGMSTVPEAIVARALGMRVAAVSCITNVAAGLSPGTLSHDEVLEVGARARQRLAALLKEALSGMENGEW